MIVTDYVRFKKKNDCTSRALSSLFLTVISLSVRRLSAEQGGIPHIVLSYISMFPAFGNIR